ncbi:MAG: hypothetical protein ABJZ55_10815 [Fuerstiella sp.]
MLNIVVWRCLTTANDCETYSRLPESAGHINVADFDDGRDIDPGVGHDSIQQHEPFVKPNVRSSNGLLLTEGQSSQTVVAAVV